MMQECLFGEPGSIVQVYALTQNLQCACSGVQLFLSYFFHVPECTVSLIQFLGRNLDVPVVGITTDFESSS